MAFLGALGGIGALISGVGSVVSGVMGAAAAQDAADAQAAAYEYNAAVARNNAIAARDAANAEAEQVERQNKLRLGKLQTDIIKQGVALEGTPLLILDEEYEQGQLERSKEVYKGEVKARNYENDANLNMLYADSARQAGANKAGASLLGGVFGGIGRMFG